MAAILTPLETARKKRFFHRARVRARVAVCWDVFTDHERLTEFTDSVASVVQPGRDERNGLGCIRRFETLGGFVDEVVNYWQPHELFGYHVISTDLVTHHQGIVRFFALPDGCTEWVYDMQLIPREDVLKAMPQLPTLLADGFRNFMACLECECERRNASFVVPPEPIPVGVHGGQLGA